MMPGADSRSARIIVLLPVYNGAKFLCEQIESILAQSHKNLQLICRDDGSSDDSSEILQCYATNHPEQIKLLLDTKGNLGASGSFSELMAFVLAEFGGEPGIYVALADQDDTWHLDKLQHGLDAMLAVERKFPQLPLLVHSDLRVVEANGDEIAPSLMQYQGLNPKRTEFSAQLISNTVTGCTSLMNMALLKKALPVPPQAVMHDWWLSLVASAFGRLVFVPAALVEYRQHGRNTLGAREHKKASLNWQTLRKVFQLRQTVQAGKLFQQAATQAQAFESAYTDELTASHRKIIRDVVLLPQLGLWQQRLLFRRLKK